MLPFIRAWSSIRCVPVSAVSPWVFGAAPSFCGPSAKSEQRYSVSSAGRESWVLSAVSSIRVMGDEMGPWPHLSASGIMGKRK